MGRNYGKLKEREAQRGKVRGQKLGGGGGGQSRVFKGKKKNKTMKETYGLDKFLTVMLGCLALKKNSRNGWVSCHRFGGK